VKNLPDNSISTSSLRVSEVWWPLWERVLGRERRAAGGETEIAALTTDMARGGEDAFREFYDRYFNRLLGYLLVLTRGHEDVAREALQTAMLRVVKHVRRFESEPAFWSWLTVLARTALVDQERKRNRYVELLDRFGGENVPASETHLVECLKQSVATLPPDELVLIERKYFEGEAVAHIAASLNLSEKAVESRLGRIRQKLKQQTLELLK
jgi:RNA polymerase sigma-70 factor, ECF subfamily